MEETQTPPPQYSGTVDTSSPFNSVKEAVAMFGRTHLSEEIGLYSPSPNAFTINHPKQDQYYSPSRWRFSPSKPNEYIYEQITLVDTLKRFETELQKTKMEVKRLKEREFETEVALASLNADLHKNMSKIALVEAAEAARPRTSTGVREEERRRRRVVRLGDESPYLAQILSVGENEGLFGGRKDRNTKKKEKNKKKKSINIPLFGYLFSRKKGCLY